MIEYVNIYLFIYLNFYSSCTLKRKSASISKICGLSEKVEKGFGLQFSYNLIKTYKTRRSKQIIYWNIEDM